jgi:hypothetical protein
MRWDKKKPDECDGNHVWGKWQHPKFSQWDWGMACSTKITVENIQLRYCLDCNFCEYRKVGPARE